MQALYLEIKNLIISTLNWTSCPLMISTPTPRFLAMVWARTQLMRWSWVWR